MRLIGGEELAHDPALGHAEHTRLVPADGVHDRQDVLDPLIERRDGFRPVGEPDAPLVEPHARQVLSQVLDHASVQLVLPADVGVRDQRGNDEERWAITPLLEREPQIP